MSKRQKNETSKYWKVRKIDNKWKKTRQKVGTSKNRNSQNIEKYDKSKMKYQKLIEVILYYFKSTSSEEFGVIYEIIPLLNRLESCDSQTFTLTPNLTPVLIFWFVQYKFFIFEFFPRLWPMKIKFLLIMKNFTMFIFNVT